MYNEWNNSSFDWCVWVLEVIAPRIGMTYNEINIWLFVIIHPLITLGAIAAAVYYRKKFLAHSRTQSVTVSTVTE
jgi:hypothetical protein